MTKILYYCLAALLSSACGGQTSGRGETDSSAYWLKRCGDKADCDVGLDCIGGLCSSTCSQDTNCSAFSNEAVCAQEDNPPSGSAGFCSKPCDEDRDCGEGNACETVCVGTSTAAPDAGSMTCTDLSEQDCAQSGCRPSFGDAASAGGRVFAGCVSGDLTCTDDVYCAIDGTGTLDGCVVFSSGCFPSHFEQVDCGECDDI